MAVDIEGLRDKQETNKDIIQQAEFEKQMAEHTRKQLNEFQEIMWIQWPDPIRKR